MRAGVTVGVLAALVSSGCGMRPAENRAVADSKVGQAQQGGLTLAVADGLASVRELAPGSLVLWGNAPAFTARVEVGAQAPADWLLTVRNAMPGAVPVAEEEGGTPLAQEALPQALPTVKVWRPPPPRR